MLCSLLSSREADHGAQYVQYVEHEAQVESDALRGFIRAESSVAEHYEAVGVEEKQPRTSTDVPLLQIESVISNMVYTIT